MKGKLFLVFALLVFLNHFSSALILTANSDKKSLKVYKENCKHKGKEVENPTTYFMLIRYFSHKHMAYSSLQAHLQIFTCSQKAVISTKKTTSPPIKTSKCVHSYGLCQDINSLSINISMKMATKKGQRSTI